MNILNLLRWLLPCCCCFRKRPNVKAIMDISRHFLEDTSQFLANKVDDYCWWSKWYQLMGLGRLNPQGLDFSKAKNGYWNIPISKGLTLKKVLKIIDEYFTVNSLNIVNVKELQTKDIRSASKQSYLISLKLDEIISDCQKKEANLQELDNSKVAMTLMERLLLELCYWSITGQHLDSNSTMLRCCGSTYNGENIDVYWSSYLGGIVVDRVTNKNDFLIKRKSVL